MTELRRPTLGQRIALLVESLLLTVLVQKQRVGRAFGLLFKLPLLFLRLRLGSLIPRNILILTTTGRRTGLLGRTPMEFSPGPSEGEYVVMAGWGGRTDWYQNPRADPHVRVWLQGREWDAIAVPVPDHEVARLMMDATQVNPFARGIWSRWSDVPIDGSQESYLKAAPHFPSLYLRPEGRETG